MLAFVLEPAAIRKILAHLAAKQAGSGRAPPPGLAASGAPAH
ncbi:MAG TPA: hypothetical protein VNJ70_06845 [Thermoanaerobaculia bacterium]|nr:hypothetical protein [Thermoanaerobaculia bacterium]